MSTPYDLTFQRNPNTMPVHIEDQPLDMNSSAAQGVAAASGANPAATTAGASYTFAWTAATVRHVMLQNNTGASLNYEIDAAATAGSPVLATGQTVFLDITMSTLHLLTAAVQNVNGAAANNIVVRAWQ